MDRNQIKSRLLALQCLVKQNHDVDVRHMIHQEINALEPQIRALERQRLEPVISALEQQKALLDRTEIFGRLFEGPPHFAGTTG